MDALAVCKRPAFEIMSEGSMHPYFFFAIHHAIVLSVVAFFVLFAASKASGFVKILGNVLGYLFLIVALLCIVCAATAPMFGGNPFGLTMMEHMHPGIGPCGHPPGPPPGPLPGLPPAK
jgi:hypothetical protein